MVKTTNKNEPREYLLLNLYDVMLVENKSKLIYSFKEGISVLQFYVTELFNVPH